jgi:hypothetical protein
MVTTYVCIGVILMLLFVYYYTNFQGETMETELKTKRLIKLIAELVKAIDESRKTGDGFEIQDVVLFVPVLSLLGPAVDALDEIGQELKGLKAEDARKLVEFAMDEVVLSNKDLEEKAKAALALALDAFVFARMFK